MPIHDWTRVNDGIFHHFHQRWVGSICEALNDGLLPLGYYALEEQFAGDANTDVLALQTDVADGDGAADSGRGMLALADAPPRIQFTAETEMAGCVAKQNTVIVRHSSGNRIVALIEVVSRGNKASRHQLDTFVQKAAEALRRGYHLLLLDLHPPGPRDPQGIHGALWERLTGDPPDVLPDKPLTLASYPAGPVREAYVEPVAVGSVLPPVPLFLQPGWYILLPLEPTYQVAFRGVPQRWRRVLEAPLPPS